MAAFVVCARAVHHEGGASTACAYLEALEHGRLAEALPQLLPPPLEQRLRLLHDLSATMLLNNNSSQQFLHFCLDENLFSEAF